VKRKWLGRAVISRYFNGDPAQSPYELSYVISCDSAIDLATPSRSFERLESDVRSKLPITSTWMMARIRKINPLSDAATRRSLNSNLVNACKQEVEVCCFNRFRTYAAILSRSRAGNGVWGFLRMRWRLN